MSDEKLIYLNAPQYLFELVQAHTNVLVWGRRTGKTNYPMARFILNNVLSMPMSQGFLIASTYEQMLTRTLGPLREGLLRLGFREDVHYWIGKFAPPNLLLPKSVLAPKKPHHYIHFLNGSGIFLVSQDIAGSINGVASQWGCGDEAKYLNKDKLDNEAMLTLSGMPEFRGLSNYQSLFFSSDMPREQKGRWLFDYEDLMDKKKIDFIATLQQDVYEMMDSMGELSESGKKYRMKIINEKNQYLNELRKGTVYYSEASSLDNIHVLGLETFAGFKRNLDKREYQSSVLNRRVRGNGRNFYAHLDFDKHGYESPNYGYIETIEDIYKKTPVKDCRWDGDILRNKPLSIACDYNAAINCVVTGQFVEFSNKLRFLSSKYVLQKDDGKNLKHLVLLWHDYYKYHQLRVDTVDYYYDPTADWEKSDDSLPYSEQWRDELTKLGWKVNMIHIGAIPSFKKRWIEWNKVLIEQGDYEVRFEFNKTNCYQWYVSASETEAIDVKGKDGNTKIEKNKTNEKNPLYPQEEAPHLSDAGDILFWGILMHVLFNSTEYIGPE